MDWLRAGDEVCRIEHVVVQEALMAARDVGILADRLSQTAQEARALDLECRLRALRRGHRIGGVVHACEKAREGEGGAGNGRVGKGKGREGQGRGEKGREG
jgi:hypothetical protein